MRTTPLLCLGSLRRSLACQGGICELCRAWVGNKVQSVSGDKRARNVEENLTISLVLAEAYSELGKLARLARIHPAMPMLSTAVVLPLAKVAVASVPPDCRVAQREFCLT